MSAGVSEQRVKGQEHQVDGAKDPNKVKEAAQFETVWHPQLQQQLGYHNAMTPEQYYQYQSPAPYQYPNPAAYNMGDRSWTNAPEALTYVGGYLPTPETYNQPSVYNAQYNHPTPTPGYNYYIAQKPFEGYYRAGDQMYGVPVNEQIKTIEQDVQALSVNDYRDNSGIQQKKVSTWAAVPNQPVKPVMSLTSVTKKKNPGMPPQPIPGKNDVHWESKAISKPLPPPVVQVQAPIIQAPIIQAPIIQAPIIQAPVVVETKPQSWNDHINVPSYNAPPMAEIPTHIPPPDHIRHVPPPTIIMSSPPPLQILNSPTEEITKRKLIDELKMKNHYNPAEYSNPPEGSRFFIIKSYSEDDIHRSIKYEIWCSTDHGNRRLDQAFSSSDKKKIFLLYSVNGSGHFCGVAEMISAVDYNSSSSVWCQDKWKGQFGVRYHHSILIPNLRSLLRLYRSSPLLIGCQSYTYIYNVEQNQPMRSGELQYRPEVKKMRIYCPKLVQLWIYVKDVPNNQLRHIRLENNENKPVTHSRDTQEVPYNQGVQVLRIIHSYRHETSIFDDFQHYENLQKLEDNKKSAAPFPPSSHSTINKYNHMGPVQFLNDNRPPQQNHYKDWENKPKDTKVEGRENSYQPQKFENFSHNHRPRTDYYRSRNENYSKEENFREHNKTYRSDQNRIRNDHHCNWDEQYRSGNNFNRGRRGRGGPSVFVNSNLKQTNRGYE